MVWHTMNEINRSLKLAVPITSSPPLAYGKSVSEGNGRFREQVDDFVELSAGGLALSDRFDREEVEDDGIRINKVARIRSELISGNYDVNGKIEAVLDSLLGDVLA